MMQEQGHFQGAVLFYASLYPGTWNPVHGLFVYELRKALCRICPVPAIVPENGWRRLFASPAPFSFSAEGEEDVSRPTFWTVPRIGAQWAGQLMALFTRSSFRRSLAAKPCIVHAHYAFPEAEAAAKLAAETGLPLVVTVHGSDINLLGTCPARRKRIVRTLERADAVVGVSKALCERVCAMGIDRAKVSHVPNGVDLGCFQPVPEERDTQRVESEQIGSRKVLLAVGRLESVKAYDRLLQAFAMLDDDCVLVFAGDGSLRSSLQQQAGLLGVKERVLFLGALSRDDLAAWYRKASLLVISSHSEGWPTIIYEALACNTPVVAPDVGGIREILHSPELGVLLTDNAPLKLAEGIRGALATCWRMDVLRDEAERNSWDSIARQYVEIYRKVV